MRLAFWPGLGGGASSLAEIAPVLEERGIESATIDPGYGLWVFPGGYVDRGEEVRAAAIREAREESGLDVRIDRLVNVYSYPGGAPVIIVYAATPLGGELCNDEECLEARIFSADALPWSHLAFRSTTEALRDYLEQR